MGLLSEGERHENEVPLLENLYPDCPGCKCAYLSAKGAGPPVKELFMITMIVICNGEEANRPSSSETCLRPELCSCSAHSCRSPLPHWNYDRQLVSLRVQFKYVVVA